MYKKNEIIDLQKTFAVWHFRVLAIMLLFLFLDTLKSLTFATPLFTSGLIVCGLLIVECVFRIKDYFRNTRLIFAIKYIQIIVLTFLFMSEGHNYYEYIIFVMMNLTIIIEFSMFFDITEKSKIAVHCLVSVLPAAISGFVMTFYYMSVEYFINSLLVMVVEAAFIATITAHIGRISSGFMKSILAKERIIDKARDTNEEIIEKQQRLFYVNEQLGIKRIELESAYKKINSNVEEMNLQNDVLKYFTSTFDITDMSKYLASQLLDRMDVICAGIVTKDKILENNKNTFESEYCLYGEVSEGYKEALRDYVLNDAALKKNSKKLHICNDIDYSKTPFLAERRTKSIAVKRIYVDGKYSGTYVICHKEESFFDERETYFENLLNQLQVVINNAFLYMKFFDMAKKDGLTGLYNRRSLNKDMEKYRNINSDTCEDRVAVALFDIDNFKGINDTYGHLFGDTVITSVASNINTIAEKAGGISYRYGGEEFVVIFKNKNSDEILPVISDIHEAIKSTVITDGAITIKADTSIGISSFPDTCKNINMVMDAADRAMYYSKANGKGRITVDSGGKYTE